MVSNIFKITMKVDKKFNKKLAALMKTVIYRILSSYNELERHKQHWKSVNRT